MSTTRMGRCFCFTDEEGGTQVVVLAHVAAMAVEEGPSGTSPIRIRFGMIGGERIDTDVTREMARQILDDLWLKHVTVPADNEDVVEPKAWVTE